MSDGTRRRTGIGLTFGDGRRELDMLERVSLGQARFHVPGLALDGRGVTLGSRAVLAFPSLDRLVAFFRVYAEEASIDDLLPSLGLCVARGPVGSQELLCSFATPTSYLLDQAARAARLAGGLVFTGAGRHYVKYRDRDSPLGYDATELADAPGDPLLYGDAGVQSYERARELSFARLVLQLQLAASPRARDEPVAECFVRVPEGLGRRVAAYLCRSGAPAEATLCEPETEPAGGPRTTAQLLVRLRAPEPRLIRLFAALPGVQVLVPVLPNVAVEHGYRHPIALSSCAQVFPADRLHLLASGRDGVTVLAGPPPWVDVRALGEPPPALRPEAGADSAAPDLGRLAAPAPFAVPLRLARGSGAGVRATASLVPPERLAWLKRLVFLLPPSELAGCRIALTPRGAVLLGERHMDALPVGELLTEAAPGVYVPLGMELVPRARPEVVSAMVGAGAGRLVVFPGAGERPFAVPEDRFARLDERALAPVDVEEVPSAERQAGGAEPAARVVNEPVGRFALWGVGGGGKGRGAPSS